MTDLYSIHTIDSAPAASKPLLKKAQDNFGMIPNFHAVIAEAPAALEAYMMLHELFSQTSFSSTEQHIVWMTINTENDCHYCIPAHVMLATVGNVDNDIITAVRNKKALSDPKLETLRKFTISVVQNRGHVDELTIHEFHNAGYTKQNVLEVILCLSQKVLSNYSNHITHVPVDDAFKKFI
ncbi:MAG: carboxymuconolactone decarboxylase family protein [Gammaproteobacteria bacterium]